MAIAPVAVRLEDADRHVTESALRILSQLTEKGDQLAIAAAAARLEDADPYV